MESNMILPVFVMKVKRRVSFFSKVICPKPEKVKVEKIDKKRKYFIIVLARLSLSYCR
jgi:hypothetical protein